MINWLTVAVFLPLAGIGLIWLVSEGGHRAARWIALTTSVVTLALVAWLVFSYQTPQAVGPVAYAYDAPWLSSAGLEVGFHLGLDGLSLWMFGLSALLTFTGVLVSWEAIEDRAPGFYSLLLLLETGMLGVFAARDLILFYIFFEFTLIPLFFLIGVWGSEDRRYAAVKFFLFTLAGSLLTFLGLLSIVLWNYYRDGGGVMAFSFDKIAAGLAEAPLPASWQLWIFLALFAGFAIKVPLFPLHTWLPLAHVQAPTAGSVLLAGILLKIGTYGFVRFSLPWLPDATVACMPWILYLSVAGIIYGALVALAQSDVKRLIAYSSVSHLGFCMLGIFSLNKLGVQGGVLQMINHGISTGGLFALVGMIYERYHTREISQLTGLARTTPRLAVLMLLFTFSSIGLPGLNGFAGEFMLLLGAFQRGWVEAPESWTLHWRTLAVLAVTGVVLGAWYMLWLIERVFFLWREEKVFLSHDARHGHEAVHDLSGREVLALAPLVLFVFWIGVQPQFFLDRMAPELDHVVAIASRPLDRRNQAAGETAVAARPEGTSRAANAGPTSDARRAGRDESALGDSAVDSIAEGELARVD